MCWTILPDVFLIVGHTVIPGFNFFFSGFLWWFLHISFSEIALLSCYSPLFMPMWQCCLSSLNWSDKVSLMSFAFWILICTMNQNYYVKYFFLGKYDCFIEMILTSISSLYISFQSIRTNVDIHWPNGVGWWWHSHKTFKACFNSGPHPLFVYLQ